MNNLLDGIRRFKLARHTANKPAEAQDEIDGLVKMYEAIGPGDEARKLAFDRQWSKLSEEKRSELVKRLLDRGVLPEQVGHALEIFNGKVVSLV
jgi:hypothetical protein